MGIDSTEKSSQCSRQKGTGSRACRGENSRLKVLTHNFGPLQTHNVCVDMQMVNQGQEIRVAEYSESDDRYFTFVDALCLVEAP